MTQNFQTENLQLIELQAQNEQKRKKLETFRSGLEKLMNKKKKKPSLHEVPSQDNANFNNNYNNQYLSQSSNPQNPSPKYTNQSRQGGNADRQMDFGFNSTLFRQIGNDSGVMENNSGFNRRSPENKLYSNYALNSPSNYASNYPSNYASNYASNQNYTLNKEYVSASSKQSGDLQFKGDIHESQSYSNSFKVFSKIDELMNKRNSLSKLPTKQIQIYLKKTQQKRSTTDHEYLDIDLSKSGTQIFDENYFMKKTQAKPKNKLKTIQQNQDQNRKKTDHSRQQIKNATSFLKNYKQKSEAQSKAPPLPPNSQNWLTQKKKKANQVKERFQGTHVSELNEKINFTSNYSKKLSHQQNQIVKSPSKGLNSQNSTQNIRNKLKQTLSQRKKIVKQGDLLDDSIQLQLSEQQDQKQQRVKQLQKQKQDLLQQLAKIQQQLEKLQNS